MMDTAPIADVSPPYPPKNPSYTPLENKVVLRWNPSIDPTKGSWVVGYNIYSNGAYENMAFGTKYTTKINPKASYEVRAVNTNGIESEPLIIIVK